MNKAYLLTICLLLTSFTGCVGTEDSDSEIVENTDEIIDETNKKYDSFADKYESGENKEEITKEAEMLLINETKKLE